jgi:tetratricopeptide (TPR) repeat protein
MCGVGPPRLLSWLARLDFAAGGFAAAAEQYRRVAAWRESTPRPPRPNPYADQPPQPCRRLPGRRPHHRGHHPVRIHPRRPRTHPRPRPPRHPDQPQQPRRRLPSRRPPRRCPPPLRAHPHRPRTASRPDHPDTLTSRNNLATAYRAVGRFADALPLYERTLADRERLLGPDHPSTLTSRSNLAGAYRAVGRLADALPLHESTLADYERILGPEHPDTEASRLTLEAIRRELHKND